MKLLYVAEIVFMSLVALCSVQVSAQNRRMLTRAQLDSILHPKVIAGAEKVIRFSKPVVSIGTMTEDHEPVEVTFSFRNIGNQTLTVKRITTDCGCTVARSDKPTYAPREKGVVTIQYTPKNHVGTIDASAWMFTSLSDSQPVAKLTILGEVLPGEDCWKGYRHTMGALRLKQQALNFQVGPEGKQTERILCANSGTKPLKLSVDNLPPFIQFRTEPTIIQPGDEADIVIRVDGTQYTGERTTQQFPLILDGLSVPVAERTLNLTIQFSE